MMEKADIAFIQSLDDKVLQQVQKEKTIAGVWLKHEGLYMNKSFVNRLYLKKTLYSFKMSEEKVLIEQLDMFNLLILDLKNIDAITHDEYQVLLLLCMSLKSYVHFKETLLYVSNL